MTVIAAFPGEVQQILSQYILNELIIQECTDSAVTSSCLTLLAQSNVYTPERESALKTNVITHIQELRTKAQAFGLFDQEPCAYTLTQNIRNEEYALSHFSSWCDPTAWEQSATGTYKYLQTQGTSIIHLTLSSNGSKQFIVPEAIRYLPNLKSLTLVSNVSIQLTPQLGSLLQLRTLEVQCSSPEQTEPPAEAKRLKSRRPAVQISWNRIEVVSSASSKTCTIL